MIFLATAILAVIAIFGAGTMRVALQDLALLETQQAAQRAAEAAASVTAELVLAQSSDDAIQSAATDEALAVARANVMRGDVTNVAVNRSPSANDLANLTVTVLTSYGGMTGPLSLRAVAAAGVPKPRSQ